MGKMSLYVRPQGQGRHFVHRRLRQSTTKKKLIIESCRENSNIGHQNGSKTQETAFLQFFQVCMRISHFYRVIYSTMTLTVFIFLHFDFDFVFI